MNHPRAVRSCAKFHPSTGVYIYLKYDAKLTEICVHKHIYIYNSICNDVPVCIFLTFDNNITITTIKSLQMMDSYDIII